jgi:phospholipase C
VSVAVIATAALGALGSTGADASGTDTNAGPPMGVPAAGLAAGPHLGGPGAARAPVPARHVAVPSASRYGSVPSVAGLAAASSQVRHVVVIFLENHSFDSLLGFWCDDHPRRCPDGGMPASVTLSNGTVVKPFSDPDRVPVVLHDVEAQQAVIDGGKMDGWQKIPDGSCDAATGYRCISGYKPWRIPNLITLAQHFAISDHTFSLADSPSWEGHMAIVAASTDHFYGNNGRPAPGVPHSTGWGCDSDKVTDWVAPNGTLKTVPSCVPDPALGLRHGGAFRKTPVSYVPTIMDRFDAAGLTWKIYGAPKGMKGYGYFDICPTFAECLYSTQDADLVPDAQFLTDTAHGNLPNFSVITPGGGNMLRSCHNGVSITKCDNWIGQLTGAMEKSPEWSSSVVFITFDDCGCFYDQVVPPVEPDGTQEGLRVPLIIVSPYARSGYTDTTPTTFAGILAYTEQNFGLTPLGVNDAGAYPFTSAFDYSQRPLKPVRMVTRPLPASAKRIHLTPALEQDPT